MNVRYVVELSDGEVEELEAVIASTKTRPQKRRRAQILLAANRGVPDVVIAETLPCGTSTIYRTKKRLVEEGFEAALEEVRRDGGRRKLLADNLVRLVEHDSISKETVRRRLAENELKPWRRKMWCIPKVDAEFVNADGGRPRALLRAPTRRVPGCLL